MIYQGKTHAKRNRTQKTRKMVVNLKKMERMKKKARKAMIPRPSAVSFFTDITELQEEVFMCQRTNAFPFYSHFSMWDVRQKSNIDNGSEHTFDDQWPEDGNAHLSETWTGSTRCQILRPTRGVNGRPTEFQQTRRPDTIWQKLKVT